MSDEKHRSPESIHAEEVSLDNCRDIEHQDVPARECHVPVRPGWGPQAFKRGCEDEYIERMNARYGGEW